MSWLYPDHKSEDEGLAVRDEARFAERAAARAAARAMPTSKHALPLRAADDEYPGLAGRAWIGPDPYAPGPAVRP
jgi:hypothetical protein